MSDASSSKAQTQRKIKEKTERLENPGERSGRGGARQQAEMRKKGALDLDRLRERGEERWDRMDSLRLEKRAAEGWQGWGEWTVREKPVGGWGNGNVPFRIDWGPSSSALFQRLAIQRMNVSYASDATYSLTRMKQRGGMGLSPLELDFTKLGHSPDLRYRPSSIKQCSLQKNRPDNPARLEGHETKTVKHLQKVK